MVVNCAIIGLGRIGCGFDDSPNSKVINTHAGAYLKNSKTNLIALCDTDKTKLKKYGEKFHIKNLYTDYKTMLKNEKIDCLSICTWANSHYNIVQTAAKYNVKGIFLEKPISNSLNDAKKIIKTCLKNNIKLQVDHQRRFSKFFNKIKQTINEKKFGVVQNVNIVYGSGVFNTGTHIFDLVRYLFSEVSWVEAKFSKIDSKIKNDPNIEGKIQCKNGTICNLICLNDENFRILEFDIIGTNGRLIIDLTSSRVKYFVVNKKQKGLVYGKLVGKKILNNEKKEYIRSGLDNLLSSIKNNSTILCNGNDGFKALEIAFALQFSAKSKQKRISLPLSSNRNFII